MEIKNGILTKSIPFIAISPTDQSSRVTGALTGLAVMYSINGSASASMASPEVTHIANGVWSLAIDEAAVVALPVGLDSVTVALNITANEMVVYTTTFELVRYTRTDICSLVSSVATEANATSNAASVIAAHTAVLESDSYIDVTDPTQYQLVIHEKGDSAVEYIRKDLKDIDGNPIVDMYTPIAFQTEPS